MERSGAAAEEHPRKKLLMLYWERFFKDACNKREAKEEFLFFFLSQKNRSIVDSFSRSLAFIRSFRSILLLYSANGLAFLEMMLWTARVRQVEEQIFEIWRERVM